MEFGGKDWDSHLGSQVKEAKGVSTSRKDDLPWRSEETYLSVPWNQGQTSSDESKRTNLGNMKHEIISLYQGEGKSQFLKLAQMVGLKMSDAIFIK